jgi:something-about-silencing protein 4
MMFHKKMKKDEKVMANEDRLRILSEVDNLQTQLNLLNQYDWVRHLPNICSINDVRDYDELVEKKDLTVVEIENSLRKYDNWKRRSDQLAHDIKSNIETSDGADEEYNLSLETIKANRKRENRQKYGPVIKLYLNNGYLLVIDPIQPPRIVKSQPGRIRDSVVKSHTSNGIRKPSPGKHKERKRHTIATPKGALKVSPKPVLPPPTLLVVSTIKIPKNQCLENTSSVNLMTCSENGVIFGTKLSDMKVPHDGFVLPKLIKNVSKDNDQL